jgi:Ca2+-binding EF-hand superfamily protein
VKVQSEKTDLCEVIDLKKTEYELTSCSIRLENGKVEDQVPLNRLRDLDTMQPLRLKDLNVNKKIRVVQSSLASGLADLLDMYDYDGNGDVSHYEFLSLLKDGLGLAINGEEAGLLCRRLDKDNDGTISIKELRSAMKDMEYTNNKDKINSVPCAHILKGHKGSITALEYSKVQQLVVSAACDVYNMIAAQTMQAPVRGLFICLKVVILFAWSQHLDLMNRWLRKTKSPTSRLIQIQCYAQNYAVFTRVGIQFYVCFMLLVMNMDRCNLSWRHLLRVEITCAR